MAKQIDSEMLDHLVNEMSDKKSIFRVAMKVDNSAGSVSGKAAAGEIAGRQQSKPEQENSPAPNPNRGKYDWCFRCI